MDERYFPTRQFCILSGVSCIAGVVLLILSFNVNPGPPPNATNIELIRFSQEHAAAVMWGAWLQAIGPVFIVLFAFALVRLAGATQSLAGWMTFFGATVLMMVSLIEITFYIGALFVDEALVPAVVGRLIYAVQHLYFIVAAPSLFIPLGLVLVRSQILPRILGYIALAIGAAFAGAGVIFLLTLRLPGPVLQFAGVQPFWWLAAAITLMIRAGKIARTPKEKGWQTSGTE